MFSDSQLYTFSNVHLKIYNKRNKRTLREIHKKTKFALNGIAAMLKGEFNDTNYNAINNYVPKYLALGTNNPDNSPPGVNVSTSVSVNDTCLCSEYTKNDKLVRIRLEDVKREKDSGDYVRIRFRTMVTSGTIPYNTIIQELGLFVDNYNLTSGLFARIATEPILIPENSVLDVTWDVVIASSIGVLPTIAEITNSEGIVISSNAEAPQEVYSNSTYGSLYPMSINLKSSIIDGTGVVNSVFYVDEITREIIGGEEIYKWISTNNFNRNKRTVEISDNKTTVTITDTAPQFTETIPYNSSVDYKTEYAMVGTDVSGSTIKGNGIKANTFEYKDVTYKNVSWIVGCKSKDDTGYVFTEIPQFMDVVSYSKGNLVEFENTYYMCLTNGTSGEYPNVSANWIKCFQVIKYMSDCILINYFVGTDPMDICIGAKTYNNITTYTYLKLNGSEERDDLIIVPVGSGGNESGGRYVNGMLEINDLYINQVEYESTGILEIDTEVISDTNTYIQITVNNETDFNNAVTEYTTVFILDGEVYKPASTYTENTNYYVVDILNVGI